MNIKNVKKAVIIVLCAVFTVSSAIACPVNAFAEDSSDYSGYTYIPVENAADVENIISAARENGVLREDERVIFDPSVEFNSGSYKRDIVCYLDGSMMVVVWKQLVDGFTLTMAEIKLTDASQIHRVLVKPDGSTYVNGGRYLSEITAETDAVLAINADCYYRREFGIVYNEGELYRYNTRNYGATNNPAITYYIYNCLDNCFVTRSGKLLFKYFGTPYTADELMQYCEENDVAFSLSFGPVLVDNYEVKDHYVGWYPVGEVDELYSRVALGTVDDLHYIYACVNHSDEKPARWTMKMMADFMGSLGVENAYGLDGGQTGELIINGEIYNRIDYGEERHVSDMIYFR